MSGKVDVEIFRAYEGCRWYWDVWIDRCPISNGVEDTYDQAAAQARHTVDTHVNIYKEGSRTCKPIETDRCLHGTDCPAWLCSECGELFEEGANFCSKCGAKVVGV